MQNIKMEYNLECKVEPSIDTIVKTETEAEGNNILNDDSKLLLLEKLIKTEPIWDEYSHINDSSLDVNSESILHQTIKTEPELNINDSELSRDLHNDLNTFTTTKKIIKRKTAKKRKRNTSRKKNKCVSCDKCGKRLKSHVYLGRHMTTRHASERFQCQECGKFYSRKESYRQHIITHFPDRSVYGCSHCDVKFKNLCDYRLHLWSHNGVPVTPIRLRFKCSICDESFCFKSSLENHILTHNDLNIVVHICPHCEKIHKSALSLHLHLIMDCTAKPQPQNCTSKLEKNVPYNFTKHFIIREEN